MQKSMFTKVLDRCLGDVKISETTLDAFMRSYWHPANNKQHEAAIKSFSYLFEWFERQRRLSAEAAIEKELQAAIFWLKSFL